MQRLINTGLLTLLTATALCGAGCKRAARDDSSVSAPKPVETTQQPSQAVVQGAEQAQRAGEGSYAEPDQKTSDFSWVRPGTWNSAPSGGETHAAVASAEANETNEPSDEITRSVETNAMLTVAKDAMTKSVSKSEIVVTSGDQTSFHMVRAKLAPDTKITRNGEAASINDIKQGDHVTVVYKMENSQPVATSIEILGGER